MDKVEIAFENLFNDANEFPMGPPWLLASVDSKGRPNVMTIGGIGFAKVPFGFQCLVFVTPSRHTYKLIERTGDFTVNLPRAGMDNVVAYCGKVSGRDREKFKEVKLTATPSRKVAAPIVDECAVNMECQISAIFDPRPESFGDKLRAYYSSKTGAGRTDYHRLFQATIVAIYADEDVVSRLHSERTGRKDAPGRI